MILQHGILQCRNNIHLLGPCVPIDARRKHEYNKYGKNDERNTLQRCNSDKKRKIL